MTLKEIIKELKTKETWDKVQELCAPDFNRWKKFKIGQPLPKEYVVPLMVVILIGITTVMMAIMLVICSTTTKHVH